MKVEEMLETVKVGQEIAVDFSESAYESLRAFQGEKRKVIGFFSSDDSWGDSGFDRYSGKVLILYSRKLQARARFLE